MPPATDFIDCSAALCEAVLRLRGETLCAELGRIAGRLLGGGSGVFHACGQAPQPNDVAYRLSVDCAVDAIVFGRFDVSRSHDFDDQERHALQRLASMTAALLQVHSLAQRSSHAYAQIEAQLAYQGQILDQINESVLTLDRQGYITSWNKGAERLFGYSEVEALGRNVLFLYADEEAGFDDTFLQHGGNVMEVRRRKKSGEVFWASMSLAPLTGRDGRQAGLIAYLTDITERKLAQERLHHLAYYDALTGLPNRSLLAKLLDQALAVAQRKECAGCVLFIDLNRFKPINDTLGRALGDSLLQQVAQRFRGCLRDQDVVARLSGDEFAVALFDVREHFEASTVAAKLQACLVEPFLIGGHELRIGASIGISVYPQDGLEAESLLRLADIAMERAKQGREDSDASVAFFSSDMNQGMQDRMRIESGLRQALRKGELLLHYQPKFAIGDERIVGAEALVRWQHPQQGMVPPGQFIPVAESTGLIVPLGEWVLEAACAQAAAWQAAGFAPFRVAVNVSAREFTPALPERVRALLVRHALAPAWLELEITESTLMNDIERVIDIMDQINALGVALSLDDFGTGYSSLSYLKRFPIDTLKIDRSFTMGLPTDANDCAIASTIISIAQQLKHRVIAEGVETQEQLDFLRSAGCDEVQGYLYSKPLSADAFEEALRGRWLRHG